MIRAFALTLLASFACLAADFTGVWKMDPAKSDYGLLPMPDSVTLDVKQTGESVEMKFAQEGGRAPAQYTHKYSIDGKESVNELLGNQMKTVASKQGESLKFSSTVNYRGRDLRIADTWTMAADGKSMVYKRNIAAPELTIDVTMTMLKQ